MKQTDKKQEILNAALSLFSSRGYLETSMTDIAEAVQMTKGGLYHYLDKKEDALVLIHEQMTDAFLSGIRRSIESAKDPEEKLRNWIREHVILMKEYQPHINIFFTQLNHLKHSKRFDDILEKRDAIFNMLYDIIRQGQREKRFSDKIHPRVLTFLIFGMLNWFYQWFQPQGPRSIDNIISDVEHLVFDGIRKS